VLKSITILATTYRLRRVFIRGTLYPHYCLTLSWICLAVVIARAKEEGQVGGLIPHLFEGGVSILQYADDTILFMEHNLAKGEADPFYLRAVV
jgi:hypothetical protein